MDIDTTIDIIPINKMIEELEYMTSCHDIKVLKKKFYLKLNQN